MFRTKKTFINHYKNDLHPLVAVLEVGYLSINKKINCKGNLICLILLSKKKKY